MYLVLSIYLSVTVFYLFDSLVCVYLSLCFYFTADQKSVYVLACHSVCLSTYIYISVCLAIHSSACLSIYIFVYLFIFLSVSLYIYLSISKYGCPSLSIYLSIAYLSVSLLISMFVYLISYLNLY